MSEFTTTIIGVTLGAIGKWLTYTLLVRNSDKLSNPVVGKVIARRLRRDKPVPQTLVNRLIEEVDAYFKNERAEYELKRKQGGMMKKLKALWRFLIFWLKVNANPRVVWECEFCKAKFRGFLSYNRGMRHLIEKHPNERVRVLPLDKLERHLFG